MIRSPKGKAVPGDFQAGECGGAAHLRVGTPQCAAPPSYGNRYARPQGSQAAPSRWNSRTWLGGNQKMWTPTVSGHQVRTAGCNAFGNPSAPHCACSATETQTGRARGHLVAGTCLPVLGTGGEGKTRLEAEPEATRSYSVHNYSSHQMYTPGVFCFH